MISKSQFRNTLIEWYLQNMRSLPWRENKKPYQVWVSEIVLQQTRVNQGLDYYRRFMEAFPDIRALAAAQESEVLKLWQGLGYYSRARNMHETAKKIIDEHNGNFPDQACELLKLKGIGKYTAAAIASIAFNEAVAVVDGNVIRFIARHFGIKEAVDDTSTLNFITLKANELLDQNDPGTFNQAMMEFGALQCTPASPDCGNCVFNSSCKALSMRMVDELPLKLKKTKVTERFFNYLVIIDYQNDKPSFFLRKRKDGDIWKHLYDFPLIESSALLSTSELANHSVFNSFFSESKPQVKLIGKTYRHVLTHRIINAQFFKIIFDKAPAEAWPVDFIATANPENFALPRLIVNFLNDSDVLTQGKSL
jgi:A/G-specific adenine glycosylase